MLRVRNIHETTEVLCIVNIDSYVPISFRSRSQPIAGARYIRLGDFQRRLIEFQFPADSLVLSGFTMVSGEGSTHGTLMGDGPSAVGLPIISLPQGGAFSDSGGIPRLDIPTDVAASCTDGHAEVALGVAEAFNRRVVYGRVQFLLSDDVLVGLRVLELNKVEQRVLREYIAQHPHQGDLVRGR